jgi:methylated-DNA-[protein]-cysteine S-methyltransferase
MTDQHAERELAAHLRQAATGGDVGALVASALDRADREGLVEVAWSTIDTPIGPLLVAVSADGLVRVAFGHDDAVLEELARAISPRVVELPRRTDPARRQLEEYFAGRRDRFEVPLDWRLARGFRRTVLEHLYADVPLGRVVSYRELAAASGSPGASRAVGTAMATNPLPIVVPCHRVLRTGGALGGYGGGLDAKRWLLAHEGVTLA